jgi:transcriptional regulator with XRE-family HTH domain
MIGSELRAKRQMFGLAGSLICKQTGIKRSRLSDIERGYVQPSDTELAQIDRALDELIRAKKEVASTAERVGWPVAAL